MILKEAEELYSKLGQNMFEDIAKYIAHGYVFKSPEYLLLGKPVRIELEEHEDQWCVAGANAWFVKTAVGHGCIEEFINHIPYPLPYVGWARELKNKKIKWYKLDQILRRRNK